MESRLKRLLLHLLQLVLRCHAQQLAETEKNFISTFFSYFFAQQLSTDILERREHGERRGEEGEMRMEYLQTSNFVGPRLRKNLSNRALTKDFNGNRCFFFRSCAENVLAIARGGTAPTVPSSAQPMLCGCNKFDGCLWLLWWGHQRLCWYAMRPLSIKL